MSHEDACSYGAAEPTTKSASVSALRIRTRLARPARRASESPCLNLLGTYHDPNPIAVNRRCAPRAAGHASARRPSAHGRCFDREGKLMVLDAEP